MAENWGNHDGEKIQPLGAGVLARLADQVLRADLHCRSLADQVLEAETGLRNARLKGLSGPALDFADDARNRAAQQLFDQLGRPGLLKRGRWGIWVWFDPTERRAVAVVQPITDLDVG